MKHRYFAKCLYTEFWKLNLQPVLDNTVSRDMALNTPIWFNPWWSPNMNTKIGHTIRHKLQWIRLRNITTPTGQQLTRLELEQRLTTHTEINTPSKKGIIKMISKAYAAIPEELWTILIQPPDSGFLVGYALSNNTWTPTKWNDKEKTWQSQWIDITGKPHATGKLGTHQEIRETRLWNGRWPDPMSYINGFEWSLGTQKYAMDKWKIGTLTKAIQKNKMHQPTCEQAWNKRIEDTLPWDKIWKITAIYTAPRDETTWLKLLHRNLWVANRDPRQMDKSCKAVGCTEQESMLHLAKCPVITQTIWMPLMDLLLETKLVINPTWKTWLFGIHKDNNTIGKEAASVIFIAWRALYAGVVKARMENKHLDLRKVNRNIYKLLICRLRAFGARWNHWKKARTHSSLPSEIPSTILELTLISFLNTTGYKIHTQITQRQKML